MAAERRATLFHLGRGKEEMTGPGVCFRKRAQPIQGPKARKNRVLLENVLF